MASIPDDARQRLVELYHELESRVEEVKHILRTECHPRDYEVAKAYWLASLSIGLNAGEYCTHNPTMEQFLMDDEGEFIKMSIDETITGVLQHGDGAYDFRTTLTFKGVPTSTDEGLEKESDEFWDSLESIVATATVQGMTHVYDPEMGEVLMVDEYIDGLRG